MKLPQLIVFLFSLILIPTQTLAATRCTDTIVTLTEADTNIRDIPSLQSDLGPGIKGVATGEIMSWSSFQIFMLDGVTVSGTGHLPEGLNYLPAPSAVEAVLGKPQGTRRYNLSRYNWTCQDSNSTAEAYTDDTGSVVYFKSTSCPGTRACTSKTSFANGFPPKI